MNRGSRLRLLQAAHPAGGRDRRRNCPADRHQRLHHGTELPAPRCAGECSMARQYVRGGPSGVIAGNGTAPAAADIGWRDFFTDARLRTLIELALQHNPDARNRGAQHRRGTPPSIGSSAPICSRRSRQPGWSKWRNIHLPSWASPRPPAAASRAATAVTAPFATSTPASVSLPMRSICSVASAVSIINACNSISASSKPGAARKSAWFAEVANAYLTLLADQEPAAHHGRHAGQPAGLIPPHAAEL